MRRRRGFFAVAPAGAAALALAVPIGVSAPLPAAARGAKAPACADGTTVQTDRGAVCGTAGDGVRAWRGIPYAAAPLGDLRWAPPASHAGWTSTLRATEPGSPCPQPPGLGPGSADEDCLKLDVVAPGKPGGKPLPVMVELHGGGFRLGAPSDGTHLVKEGGVINVGVHYRLGIFGFMAHEGLGAHSGNYALRDQQAALRWVRRNIARFGGDPGNVTIYGASAGGSSVCANTASPAAKGLFQKGIAQSGEYNSLRGVDVQWQAQDCKAVLPSEREAQRAGARFADALGCSDIACLRALPVAKLLEQAGEGIGADVGTQGPVVDGEILPMSPGQALAEGKVNDVTLMHGVDRDEVQLPSAETPAQYREFVRRQYGPLADRVFELYPLERFPEPSAFIAYRTIVADSNSVCPALLNDERLARHITVFAYQTDNPDAPPMFFLDPTKPNGSYHVSETPFLAPMPGGAELTPNQEAFGRQLTAQWTGFARTGNPTVDGTPYWPRFTRRDPAVLSLIPAGDSQVTHEIAQQHHCRFWNRYTPFAH